MTRIGGNPVTLKDVARHAQCSTAVVSTVVNKARSNTIVSEAMRQRVVLAAKELGYRPDFASRSLARRRTRTLGIYIPPGPWSGLGFTYEGSILSGVEAAARNLGYDLLLLNLAGSQTPEVCSDKFAERRVDGVLLIHAEPGSDWIQELINNDRNVVAIDYSNPEPNLNAVCFDNAAASRIAVDHLISLGHRRIGFLGSCRRPPSFDATLRQESFMKTMVERGLVVQPEWVLDWRKVAKPIQPDDLVCQKEAQLGTDHILALGSSGPTAWIAYGDFVAARLVSLLTTAGVRVPQQISVMGIDDSEHGRLSIPPLSTVRHPFEEMGKRAVELVIEKSEQHHHKAAWSQQHTGSHIKVAPSLVVRDSTAAPVVDR